jgi:hypothetical protein
MMTYPRPVAPLDSHPFHIDKIYSGWRFKGQCERVFNRARCQRQTDKVTTIRYYYEGGVLSVTCAHRRLGSGGDMMTPLERLAFTAMRGSGVRVR